MMIATISYCAIATAIAIPIVAFCILAYRVEIQREGAGLGGGRVDVRSCRGE
jgi:hypothetical protein